MPAPPPAGSPRRAPGSGIEIRRVEIGTSLLLATNVDVRAGERAGIGAVSARRSVDRTCDGLASQVVGHLDDPRRQCGRCVPGAEVPAVEAHSSRSDVQEGRHDDAGVRAVIDPLVSGQPVDTMGDEAIVRPADKLHDGREVGSSSHRIEQADRRKLRRDEAMSRDRSGRMDVVKRRRDPHPYRA